MGNKEVSRTPALDNTMDKAANGKRITLMDEKKFDFETCGIKPGFFRLHFGKGPTIKERARGIYTDID
jgi:hypothetical protein